MTLKEISFDVTIGMAVLPVVRRLRAGLTALAFWIAIALPVFYLPVLVTNLESTSLLTGFIALFGIHVLALLAGRNYHSTSE